MPERGWIRRHHRFSLARLHHRHTKLFGMGSDWHARFPGERGRVNLVQICIQVDRSEIGKTERGAMARLLKVPRSRLPDTGSPLADQSAMACAAAIFFPR